MRLQDSLKLLCFYALVVVYAKEEIKDLSHGFGTDIEWIEFDKAEELSNELKKPVFVLIHKTWCGACKQLKNSFSTSPKRNEFIQLTRKFVMVNLEDDEEPQDDKFAPDGAYIPRLYFLKGSDVLPVTNKNYPKNLYYFPQLPDVMKAMNQALKLYGGESETAESNDNEKAEKVEKKEKAKDETKDSKAKDETKDSKNEKAEKKETKTEDKKKADKKEDSKKKDEKKEDKKKDSKNEDKKDSNKKETKTEDKKKDSKKKEAKDEKTNKTDKKKEDKKDSNKKEDDKKKADKKEDKKKKEADGECPHAKKAREEKEKKASKSDSKSGKDEKKTKEPKPNTKKSEL